MRTFYRCLAVACLGFIVVIFLHVLRTAAPGSLGSGNSGAPSGSASSARSSVGVLRASRSGPEGGDERIRVDAQGPAVVESVSDSHRAGTGVSQERKRRFLEVMAEHDLSSADGEERVRRLVSAGLVAQDARAVVRQYYIQVGRCALEAMEIMAEEEGQRFDVVFADIEQALQDSRRAELLFVMISVDSMLDYCTLAASQAAGLPAPELE